MWLAFIISIVIWYVIGVIFTIPSVFYFDDDDFRVGDLIYGLLGPIVIIMIIIYYFKVNNIKDKILIKKRKNK